MRDVRPKPQRCAIYTRKSTEHNLDLAFNSLDAQREACEAYVKSQAHEGWRLLAERFDDGGLSGASLERPALQQMLAAVAAGLIDIIVVYKVDRLTRSLADFAKLVELFDTHAVSFVSVTQAFNTTSSMGRLTLNVLLSFAQFEREVIGERVRDKIAASKRKGLWVGGPIPLGYRSAGKSLVVAEDEAELVRTIFQSYLERGSIGAVVEELRRRGARTRKGALFTVGPVAHLLKNRFYVGEVVYRGSVSRGEHPPIVDDALFRAVQDRLSQAAVARASRNLRSSCLLAGRVFDDAGQRMSPSHTSKAGVRYRYYVSQALLQHRKHEAGSRARIAAADLDALVVENLRQVLAGEATDSTGLSDREVAARHMRRVVVGLDRIKVAWSLKTPAPGTEPDLDPDPDKAVTREFTIAWHRPAAVRHKGIAVEPKVRPRLGPVVAQSVLFAIARARRWMAGLVDGSLSSIEAIARAEKMGERNVRRLLPLACLSPRLIAAIADGRVASDCTVSKLTAALPHAWAEQDRRFGLA